MTKMEALIKGSRYFLREHSSLILTGLAVSGVVTTSIFTAKGQSRAERILMETANIPTLERVRMTWTCYVPAATMGAATIAAIIAAHTTNMKRQAAIAGALGLTESAFQNYKERAVEVLSEKKAQAIDDSVAQRLVNDTIDEAKILVLGTNKVLCFETFTGRYFESDHETIRKIQNDINEQILNSQYASLNDFCSKLGLARTDVGDEVGWNTDGLLDIRFSTAISEDQRPCLTIAYTRNPKSNYDRVW